MKRNIFKRPEIDVVERLSAELLVANRRLEEQSEALRQSEKARAEMLANISHDLRAPSTALRCAIDSMLEYSDLPREEMEMLLGVMNRRMGVLEHLLRDLELISSMDLPEFSMKPEPLDLAELLREYYAMQKAYKTYADRILRHEIPDNLSVMVNADYGYMTRVLDNLFSNALRYSHSGAEITVGCRVTGGDAEVYVRDTGIGIATEHLESIFERSRTVSRSRSPGGTSGHGLGLSIAQSIINKSGGRIWCESEYGSGSVFLFTLPLITL